MSVDTANPRNLCTLIDVTRRVPGYHLGDNQEVDKILDDLIAQESRDFVEETKREIVSVTVDDDPTDRIYEIGAFEVCERQLFIGDAAEVTEVVLQLQDGTVIETVDTAAWVALPRLRDSWEPITSLSFPRAATTPASLRRGTLALVTATWGFPEIPDTVRRAVATLTLFRYLNEAASAGTKLADVVNRENFNLASSLRAAFDCRRRLRVPTIG